MLLAEQGAGRILLNDLKGIWVTTGLRQADLSAALEVLRKTQQVQLLSDQYPCEIELRFPQALAISHEEEPGKFESILNLAALYWARLRNASHPTRLRRQRASDCSG